MSNVSVLLKGALLPLYYQYIDVVSCNKALKHLLNYLILLPSLCNFKLPILCFGLLSRQNRQIEDVALGSKNSRSAGVTIF